MRTRYDIDPVQAAIDDKIDSKDIKRLIRISVIIPTGVVILLAIAALIIGLLLK